MSRKEEEPYEFDRYRLDPERRVLWQGDEAVPLTPKAFSTLLALVERRGEVVEKDTLIQLVWPDTFITEATLTQNIFRLRKALGEGAGDHRYIVTVPGRGYCFVAEVRRPEPEPVEPETPAETAADEAAAAPAPRDVLGEPPAARPAAGHPGRWMAALALGLILLTALLLLLRAGQRHVAPGAATAARPPRRAVAVLGFRNLSGRAETAWLSTALAEMFTVELGVGEKLKTVSGEAVARARMDLALGDVDNLSAATLARLRSILGCDVLLVGSYLDLDGANGGRIRIDLRLQDTATGETLAVATRTRAESQLFELVSDLGRELRRDLGGGVAPEETVAARAAFPAGREARRLYSEGLEHLRTLDFLKARDLLRQATEAEPAFPLAHAALSVAWSNLGYDSKAEAESGRALALAASLSQEDQLLVEGLHEESRKNWSGAVEIYRRLHKAFPDDPEHGLRLARAQISAGDARDALTTLAALRELPAPLSSDPRIDLTEAEAAAALSDFRREEMMASRAAARGEELSAPLLVARALRARARAERLLGNPVEALASVQRAGRIFEQAGDRSGIADSRFDSAILLTAQGDLAGARKLYEGALEVYEETGNQRGRLRVERQLGSLAVQLGDIAKAKQYLQDAADIADEINDRLEHNQALTALAILQHSQGELTAAAESLDQALASFQSLGSLELEGAVHVNLASVLRDRGDLPAARGHAEEALHLLRQIGHSRGTGFALNQLGLLLIDQGELEQARGAYRELDDIARVAGFKSFQADAAAGAGVIERLRDELPAARKDLTAALSLRVESESPYDVADNHLALAHLALDEGDARGAERDGRTAADLFRNLHVKDAEALARAAVARALAAQGRPAEAERELGEAQRLTAQSENRRAILFVLIAAGRIAGDEGRVEEARQSLKAARDEARSRGLWPLRLDATLALGRLELQRGDARIGRLLLQAVSREAVRQGFKLAARQAGELLASPPRPPSLPSPPRQPGEGGRRREAEVPTSRRTA
jgi:eukaryotic-like serine/threonine-protein kinase